MMLPPHLIDYVAAHELAHLRELNHSLRFWDIVALLYPDQPGGATRIERPGADLAGSIRRASMRILHTMLRVADLERSLRFYTEVLGMRLLRRKDYPEGKFTLAFVGYGEETDTAVLELTHNWGVDKYELGTPTATSPSQWMTPPRRVRT